MRKSNWESFLQIIGVKLNFFETTTGSCLTLHSMGPFLGMGLQKKIRSSVSSSSTMNTQLQVVYPTIYQVLYVLVQDFFHQQYPLKNDDWKTILSLCWTLGVHDKLWFRSLCTLLSIWCKSLQVSVGISHRESKSLHNIAHLH